MALTDKLTAVADAIRGKTGKTEPLTLDQMPLEIAGIAAGGELPDGIKGVYYAEITPAENTNVIRISHNLDGDVILAILWADKLTIDPETVQVNIPLAQGYIATELQVLVTSSTTKPAFMFSANYIYSSGTVSRIAGANTASNMPAKNDSNNFSFYTSNTTAAMFKAGQTLQALVIATEV